MTFSGRKGRGQPPQLRDWSQFQERIEHLLAEFRRFKAALGGAPEAAAETTAAAPIASDAPERAVKATRAQQAFGIALGPTPKRAEVVAALAEALEAARRARLN